MISHHVTGGRRAGRREPRADRPGARFAAAARRLVQPAGDGRLAPRTPVPASRPRQNRSSPGRPSTARSLPVPGRDSTPARPCAAARPAGFMAGHRPTRGRNQAAEHAHDQATPPAPFDATARAKPGFRPPASPGPPQPGRRADERGSPLSRSPPSGHRIAARPAPHAVLGRQGPAQDHGEAAEMPRLRPGPRRQPPGPPAGRPARLVPRTLRAPAHDTLRPARMPAAFEAQRTGRISQPRGRQSRAATARQPPLRPALPRQAERLPFFIFLRRLATSLVPRSSARTPQPYN